MEFDTAVARVRADDEPAEEAPYEFTIVERDPETDAVLDKVVCHAYQPAEGQWIVMITDVIGRQANFGHKIAGIIDFFTEVLDEPSKEYIVSRLLDRHDPFGVAEIEPIVFWMMEEWSGRPTKSPTDFAPSRKTGGRSSTRPTSKSTSSASRRTASSTRSSRGA